MFAATKRAVKMIKYNNISLLGQMTSLKLSFSITYCLNLIYLGLKPTNLPIAPSMEPIGDQVCSQANQRLLVKENVMPNIQYIAYYRVSTQRQGASGLGLEAQRKATAQFVISSNGNLSNEYTEVESGKIKNRPELNAAIEACRKSGATLLIAKLDRLARNVAFIANLLESGVKFTAVDMPNADRFMLHVYAAMGEEEGRRISERTKSALAAAKSRGVELGCNGKILAKRHKMQAESFALSVETAMRSLIVGEGASFRVAADRLNKMNVKTARGGQWHSTSVFRVWQRISAFPSA